MKTFITLALLGACSFSLPALAGSQTLLAAADDDLVVTRLSLAKAATPAGVERAPVDFVWALDPAQALTKPSTYRAESREFWTELDATQLRKGHHFQTTAAGALVRLSPLDAGKAAALTLDDVSLSIDGRSVATAKAVKVSADAAQLREAGVDFSAGTVVFQLAPELAPGTIELSAKAASGRYLLHVYEPTSPIALDLQADRDRALAGGSVVLHAQWQAGTDAVAPRSLGGLLTSPQGYSQSIKFVRTRDGSYQATVHLPEDADTGMALWEVHSFGVAQAKGALVARDAKTSFSVSQPTARLDGQAQTRISKAQGLSVKLGVEASSAGRYELRGVLYGSDANGELKPFAMAHAARWLEPGVGHITLDYGDLARQAGMSAPFELRDLQLNDQARMGQLETRARALRFAAD